MYLEIKNRIAFSRPTKSNSSVSKNMILQILTNSLPIISLDLQFIWNVHTIVWKLSENMINLLAVLPLKTTAEFLRLFLVFINKTSRV